MKTRVGKNILVELPSTTDAERREGGTFDPKRHVAHFAKCPNADEWRRTHKPETSK